KKTTQDGEDEDDEKPVESSATNGKTKKLTNQFNFS
ncbi:unnamed protein product, partial [Adineta steineri]